MKTLHIGYSKFDTGFIEYGVETVDDLSGLDSDDITEIIKLLTNNGAKPFHIKKITSVLHKKN